MVKLKKALKKLAKLAATKPAAKAAKKASPEKKKSGPVPAAKKKAAAPKAAKKAAGVDKKKVVAKPAPKKADAASKVPKSKKGASSPVGASGKKVAGKVPDTSSKETLKAKKGAEKSPEKGLDKAADAPKGKALAKLEKAAEKSTEKTAEKSRKPPKEVTKEAPEPEALRSEAAAPEDDGPEEVFLTDAEGRRYCRVKECDQLAMVDGYCRYHYLLFWKRIQVRKKILTEGKLERYIEDLTARYPDKYLEMLRKDLKTEKDFLSAITELEIDESGVDSEYEDEAQSYLDEVRGISTEAGARDDEEF